MITDVFIVYNDPDQIKKIGDFQKESPIFHLIDEGSYKGKKEAFKLKGSWAARMTPFALLKDGEKAVKAFYSETGENVIDSVLDYLNN